MEMRFATLFILRLFEFYDPFYLFQFWFESPLHDLTPYFTNQNVTLLWVLL